MLLQQRNILLGINTFHPQSDKYGGNGPVRIANGEIQTMIQANFVHPLNFYQILYTVLYTPSTLTDDNKCIYNQFGYTHGWWNKWICQ